MNAKEVREKLEAVLIEIQASSGLDCPAIASQTKPAEELPKFDSKIWPVAVGMLAANLGVTIPNDVNIFRKEKTCIALTIDEIVAAVLALFPSSSAGESGGAVQAANL